MVDLFEIITLLCMEFNWTQDYIFDNLTLSTVKNYYAEINRVKSQRLAEWAVIMSTSAGYARGVVKKPEFDNMLDQLNGTAKKVNVDQSLRKLKAMNIPIQGL